uniref:Major histocompatibility complex class I-related gene protein-like n=1 Tax=Sinocyclocheilus anshuiensis TaxID=1608454 RepID=A0A671P6N1_9TELE
MFFLSIQVWQMLKSFSNALRRLHKEVCQIHGFSSAMNFFIFFIYVPLVHSALHTFITTYTEINGQTIAGIPEISSVTTLDGRQIDYYDSETGKLIPRQDWMKEFASGDRWKAYTEIKEQVQQTNKINIRFLKEQFNQSLGVHTYQRMYGCDWDDQTKYLHGFDEHGYDGEDFISLDVENSRYNTAVPQGLITTTRWNNDRAQLTYLRRYYRDECTNWMLYFLISKKVDLERRAPEVFLLQKDPSSLVLCHATGFYPAAVTITLLRNGQVHDEDVDLGKTLPNEDGTFQKTAILDVPPHNWKKHQYVCVVEHNGKTIQKILTEDEIISNTRLTKPYFRLVWVTGVFIVLVIGTAIHIWYKVSICLHLFFCSYFSFKWFHQL